VQLAEAVRRGCNGLQIRLQSLRASNTHVYMRKVMDARGLHGLLPQNFRSAPRQQHYTEST